MQVLFSCARLEESGAAVLRSACPAAQVEPTHFFASMAHFVARLSLIVPLVVAPWLNGCCDPRFQPLIGVSLLCATVFWCVGQWRRVPRWNSAPSDGGSASDSAIAEEFSNDTAFPGRNLLVPKVTVLLFVGILIGIWQLLPTASDPWAWARVEAQAERNANVTRTDSTLGLMESDVGGDRRLQIAPTTRSVYPTATRRRIAWLTLASVYVVLSANLFTSGSQVSCLFLMIAANGAVIAAVGVLEFITWNGHFMWVGPKLTSRFGHFGPMVYHNQAANYLGMALACWFGWSMLQPSDGPETSGRLRSRLPVYLSLAIVILLIVGIVGSMSRGALVSTLFAAVGVGGLNVARGGQWTVGRTLLVGAVVASGLLALGLTDIRSDVFNRAATLVDEQEIANNNRWSHWSDAIRVIPEYGITGGGLGAYGYLSTTFASGYLPAIFRQAHNQYLQALLEGGIMSLLLVLVAIVGMVFVFIRGSRTGMSGNRAPLTVGLAVVLFQACHALLDFCAELPANMVLFSALCGVSLSRLPGTSNGADVGGVWELRRPKVRGVFAAFLLGGVLWAATVVGQHAIVDVAMTYVPWRQSSSAHSEFQVDRAIRKLNEALRWEGRDADAKQALGEMHVMAYRLAARDALATQLKIPKDNERLWSVTAPSVIYGRAKQLAVQTELVKLEELRQQETIQKHLVPALRAYRNAIELCPTLSLSQLRLAELFILSDQPVDDRRYLAIAHKVDPGNVRRLFHAGQLYLLAGDIELAAERWRTCLEYSPRNLTDILVVSSTQADPQRVANDFLPPDLRLLWRAAEYCRPRVALTTLRAALLDRALKVVAELEDTEDADPQLTAIKGMVLGAMQRESEAIEYLRLALRRRPSNAEWQFQLAKCLQEVGDLDEAVRAARLAAGLKPSDKRFSRFLERLLRDALE